MHGSGNFFEKTLCDFFPARSRGCKPVFVQQNGADEKGALPDGVDAFGNPVHCGIVKIAGGEIAHAEIKLFRDLCGNSHIVAKLYQM